MTQQTLLEPTGRERTHGHDTERLSARGAGETRAILRTAVLQLLKAAGDRGLTDDEGAEMLRRHGVDRFADRLTFGRRRNELQKDGLVVKTSDRRDTPHGRSAIVWKAAP